MLLHTPPERKSRCPRRPEAQIPPTQQRRWRTSRCRRFHRHRRRVRQPPAQVNAPARAPRPMAPPSARRGGSRFGCAGLRIGGVVRGQFLVEFGASGLDALQQGGGSRIGVTTAGGRRRRRGLHNFRCRGLLDGERLRHQRVTAIVTLLGLRGGEIGGLGGSRFIPGGIRLGLVRNGGHRGHGGLRFLTRANSLLVHCGNVVFRLRRGEAERGSRRRLLRWRLNRRLCLLERLRGAVQECWRRLPAA